MNKVLAGITTAVLLVSLTGGVAFAKDKDTSRLGGLDLNGYCNAIGQGANSSPSSKAPNKDWTCSTKGTGKDIRLLKACQWQYGEAADNVREVVPGNVYTYVCFN